MDEPIRRVHWFLELVLTELVHHVTFCLITCLMLLIFMYRWSRFNPIKRLPKTKCVLFVIAHPDDEVMFFGPIFVNMIKEMKEQVHILCLSSGNHDGKGTQRQNELWLSCRRLGMSPSNITLLKYDALRDGPNSEWPVDLLTRIIENHVLSHSVDTVITFDGAGVSGHRNHVACYKAVTNLLAQPIPPPNLRVFLLDSVNLLRKYCLSIFDIFISYYSSQYLYVVNWKQRSDILAGMKCHASQLTWYRQLYLLSSRYILMNTLRELRKAPAALKK